MHTFKYSYTFTPAWSLHPCTSLFSWISWMKFDAGLLRSWAKAHRRWLFYFPGSIQSLLMCRLHQTRQRAATRVDLLKRSRNVCGGKNPSPRPVLLYTFLVRQQNTSFKWPFKDLQSLISKKKTPLHCYTLLHRLLYALYHLQVVNQLRGTNHPFNC